VTTVHRGHLIRYTWEESPRAIKNVRILFVRDVERRMWLHESIPKHKVDLAEVDLFVTFPVGVDSGSAFGEARKPSLIQPR